MSHATNTPAGGDVRRPAVLIVDDNQANLLALEALLDSPDVEVTRASSGEEALKELLRRDFAVVLMDVKMPGLDGFQTTELIRNRDRSRHTPIIFVTAIFTDAASEHRAYALGALDYLTKPFDEAALKAKVQALAAHYRQLDPVRRQSEALRRSQVEKENEQAAREAAEAANRAKDDFLALLSHELRAPLNAILGWTAVLQAEGGLSDKGQRAVETIARNARAQSRVIDDLLDVSAMLGGGVRLEPRVVDLRALTQAVVATLQPEAEEKGVRLQTSFAPGAYVTVGDPARLEQLAGALLDNAIKFSSAGGRVDVAWSRSGAAFELGVTDVGIGIAPEFLAHVFDRFRQADSGRTRAYGGLGIGLTLARHLAELHGGTIDAFSDGEGCGATFRVRLPARDDEVAAAAVERRASSRRGTISALRATVDAQPLAQLRLLVVDDDVDARELLAVVLGEAGADVATAASVAEARRALAGGRFDAVVSDLGMPGEDGLSLAREIRAAEGPAPARAVVAIAVSGYGSTEDRAESRRAGFQAHVTKPVDPAALIALLTRLVGAR